MNIPIEKTYGTLTSAEERRLIRRAQKGDITARDRVFLHNLPLVISCAERFYCPPASLDMEDLIQSGCIGLIKAIKKFNLKIKVKTSTYAVYWISHEIRRALEQQGRTVSLPSQVQWLGRSLIRRENENNGHSNGSHWVPMTEKEKIALFEVTRETIPLDNIMEDGTMLPGAALLDNKIDPANQLDEKEMPDRLRNLYRCLTERERLILEEFYGARIGDAPKTLTAISRDLGISRERVRQLKKRALKRLHEEAGLETKGALARAPRRKWDTSAHYKDEFRNPYGKLQRVAYISDMI
jgi:RNA polymerase sigma factor (sigma-70 family)